jgi:hypothetical protein
MSIPGRTRGQHCNRAYIPPRLLLDITRLSRAPWEALACIVRLMCDVGALDSTGCQCPCSPRGHWLHQRFSIAALLWWAPSYIGRAAWGRLRRQRIRSLAVLYCPSAGYRNSACLICLAEIIQINSNACLKALQFPFPLSCVIIKRSCVFPSVSITKRDRTASAIKDGTSCLIVKQ